MGLEAQGRAISDDEDLEQGGTSGDKEDLELGRTGSASSSSSNSTPTDRYKPDNIPSQTERKALILGRMRLQALSVN